LFRFFTTKPGGMGIELSISRTSIEAHGGRLRATPNDGLGATFQFTLPLNSERQPSPEADTVGFAVEAGPCNPP
jgi:signal transduction histidine kinase